MRDKQRTPTPHVSAFIDGLGECAPGDLLRLLNSGEMPADLALCASLAMLSSREPQGQKPPEERIQVPLDAIVKSGNPLAELTLRTLAARALNSRVRLEAVRRLGRVATCAATHGLLWNIAREGKAAPTSYQNDTITPDLMREAALRSLAEVPRPAKADVDVILEVLSQEVPNGDSLVFRAGALALMSAAAASDLERISDLAEKCSQGLTALRIVCAFSRLPERALRKAKARIVPLFIRALSQPQQDQELLELAKEIARRLSCQELVQGMSEHYSGDSLEHGRGSIAAAAMDAYGSPDEPLVKAYLAFARADCNVHDGSRCLAGLQRCGQGGQAQQIVARLVRGHSHPGYRRLLTSGAAIRVAGETRNLVTYMCDALDAIQEVPARDQAAALCIVGLIRASVPDTEHFPPFDDLSEFRDRRRQHGQREETLLQALVRCLSAAQPEQSGVVWLARRLASGNEERGALALMKCILDIDDELSHLIIVELFRAAADCPTPADLAGQSGLRQVEEMAFSRCAQYLKDELPRLLVSGKHVNRYVLDVMGRRPFDFASRVKAALTEVDSAADASALLDGLARKRDRVCVGLLGQAVGFVSPLVTDVSMVRREALRQVGNVLGDKSVPIPPQTRDEVLSQVHQCFEDLPNVRTLAYQVAGIVADPISIRPLRTRLQTDADPKGRAGIDAALRSIRERLLAEQPGPGEIEPLKQWLKHVGDLGDDILLERVSDVLRAAHPDRAVRVAALDCLAQLGNRKAIPVIDAFVSETSTSGDVLQAARHAKAVLMERKDLRLREVIAEAFPDDSPVFDLGIAYDAVFGVRLGRITKYLSVAMEHYRSGRWDPFVTQLDGVCDTLVRHVYENYPGLLGIEPVLAHSMARQDYPNRLAMSQFKKAFLPAQPLLESIHAIRGEATVAHIEDSDGVEKPGVEQEEADLALDQFRSAFTTLVTAMASWRQNASGAASVGASAAESETIPSA